jgi:hypothetical protein
MIQALTPLERARLRMRGLILVEPPPVPQQRVTLDGHPECPRCLKARKRYPDGTYASLCDYHLTQARNHQRRRMKAIKQNILKD